MAIQSTVALCGNHVIGNQERRYILKLRPKNYEGIPKICPTKNKNAEMD